MAGMAPKMAKRKRAQIGRSTVLVYFVGISYIERHT
jgi:hypothetical protein